MDEKITNFVGNAIFPLNTESNHTEERKPLFPSSTVCDTVKASYSASRQNVPNWLENKSFDPALSTELSPVETETDHQLLVNKNKDVKIEITDEDTESEDSVDKKSKESKGKRKKKSKSKHKHKKHKHKHKTRSPSPVQSVTLQEKLAQNYGNRVFIEEVPGLQYKDAFRIDRKANTENYKYESIYKKHIAHYNQQLDTCVGCQNVRLKEHKKSKKSDKYESGRYFEKENRKFIRGAPSDQVKRLCDSDSEEKQTTVIMLSESARTKILDEKSAKMAGNDVRDQLMDSKTKAYIQGKTPEINLDDGGINKEEMDYSIHHKMTEYNRLLRENPHDTNLWIDFVKYQDTVYGFRSISVKEKVPRQALLDRKISILHKALESNPACIVLKLEYLQLCEETWDADKVNKEIEQMIFTHPTDISIWKYFLTFNQSRLSVFSVSRISKLYFKCFKKLLSYRDGEVKSCHTSGTLDRDLLDIFVQYCHFLKQCGYMERAVATFQAMIEFNLFCPHKLLDLSLEDRIAVFESFWDSGVSRVGENGARGWSYWIDNEDSSAAEESVYKSDSSEEKEQEIISKQQEKWKTWLDIEQLRESTHLLPWRPDLSKDETEEDCEDMDRLVLFDDVSSAVFIIPDSLYLELILQFLTLLDIDSSGQSCFLPNLIHQQLNLWNLTQVILNNKVKVCSQGHDLDKNILKEFISNVLKQLISYFQDYRQTQLTVLWLNLQVMFHQQDDGLGKSAMKEIRKFAKSLLKLDKNRNNLVVWSCYAQLLYSLQQDKDAVDILTTALSMFTCDTENYLQMSGFTALHRIYVEIILNFKSNELSCLLERGQNVDQESHEKAQRVLFCLIEGKKFNPKDTSTISPTVVLKAKHKLLTKMEDYMVKMESPSKEWMIYFSEFVKYAALFEYSFNDIHSSVNYIDKLVANLMNITNKTDLHDTATRESLLSTCEELLKYKIKLDIHHMTTMNSPLSLLRDAIDNCLQYFPHSVYFLTVLTKMEEKSNITGRLHRIFVHYLKDLKSPVQVVLYVCSQLQRQATLEKHLYEGYNTDHFNPGRIENGLIHRLRSFLEKALECSQARHCPLIWRLYLQTEVKFEQRERAKGVLYRALQQCPWSKVIYLDGVALFGGEKLQEMVDLMMEKEIRVQIPVEEVDILMDVSDTK